MHYIKGFNPWDYPKELLKCLCLQCHHERQEIETSLKIEMMKRLKHVPSARLKLIFWHTMQEAIAEACCE